MIRENIQSIRTKIREAAIRCGRNPDSVQLVAVSKMVSQHAALGRYRDVRMIFRVSARLFTFTGILGTVLLLIFAYPYALIAKTN